MYMRRAPRCRTLRTVDFGHPAAAAGFLGALHDDKARLSDWIRGLETLADHPYSPEGEDTRQLMRGCLTRNGLNHLSGYTDQPSGKFRLPDGTEVYSVRSRYR